MSLVDRSTAKHNTGARVPLPGEEASDGKTTTAQHRVQRERGGHGPSQRSDVERTGVHGGASGPDHAMEETGLESVPGGVREALKTGG